MSKVFLGLPLYDGRAEWWTVNATVGRSSRKHQVQVFPLSSSLLNNNCTTLWANALNARDDDPAYEWFAMLHDDIVPEDFWLDTLIDLAEQHAADFLSAVSPLKNQSGLTTTGLWAPGQSRICRLSLSQINHPDFPSTFDATAAIEALAKLPEPLQYRALSGSVLVANTGCMVCRLDRAWCDKVWFENPTRMVKVNGRRVSSTLSEDWFFTKAIGDNGGRVMATRAVGLNHYGRTEFCSRDTWGQPRDVE